jgi:hypothetical protein
MTRVATTGIETGGRSARRTLPIAALLVGAFFVGIFAASLLSSALSAASSRATHWDLAVGIGGPKFDPADAQTTTVVHVEVWWPACVELQDYSWLTPAIASTPWSVTITLHTSDAFARNPNCHSAGQGALSPVGTYLSPLSFPVQLNEPLGGRALFDGSQFPAAAHPYPLK